VILRAADRVALPWKNGGGITREVAVHPADSSLSTFDWRVSLAEVSRGGPFSGFPDVDRHMAVIRGRLTLAVAGRAPQHLAADSAPVAFPGEVAAFAEPLGPPVTDLNVMTRRGRCGARLTRRNIACPRVQLTADTTLILALAPLTVRGASLASVLSALDAAQFSTEPDAEITVTAADPAADYWLIELSYL